MNGYKEREETTCVQSRQVEPRSRTSTSSGATMTPGYAIAISSRYRIDLVVVTPLYSCDERLSTAPLKTSSTLILRSPILLLHSILKVFFLPRLWQKMSRSRLIMRLGTTKDQNRACDYHLDILPATERLVPRFASASPFSKRLYRRDGRTQPVYISKVFFIAKILYSR